MKYNNELRSEQSKQNKDKIIETGKSLILEKSYNSVSVDAITKRAGVSKGAFYIHYKTKDDLIQDLINFTFSEVKEDSNKGTIYERVSVYLKVSTEKIVKEGLKTAQTWFSDTVKASAYGLRKLKYDEDYIMSILLSDMTEGEALIISKKIVAIYYGILISWCITDGQDDPMNLINDFILNDLSKMIGGK